MSEDTFCNCQVQEGVIGWGVSGCMKGHRQVFWCGVHEDFRGRKRRERKRESRGETEHLRMFVITSLPFFGFSRE